MPVASARTKQLLPLGTARLAVATAHAIFSGDGHPPLDLLVVGRLIASASRRARAKDSIHKPARIATSAVSAWNSSVRSDAGNAKNFDIFFTRVSSTLPRLVEHLYQPVSVELSKQLQQVAAASLGFDVISLEQHVANLDDSARLGDQAPDGGASGVESEIRTALEVQNGSLTLEIAGNLICGCDYSRCRRNCLFH
jgi:hypothetical protein